MIVVREPLVEDPLIAAGVLPAEADTRQIVLSDITVCKAPGSNDAATYPNPTVLPPAVCCASGTSTPTGVGTRPDGGVAAGVSRGAFRRSAGHAPGGRFPGAAAQGRGTLEVRLNGTTTYSSGDRVGRSTLRYGCDTFPNDDEPIWEVHAGGVHFATFPAPTLGTEQGMTDIVALGDAVNTAARLASLAGAGEVIASLETSRQRAMRIPRARGAPST
jgi:hypothetical protein